MDVTLLFIYIPVMWTISIVLTIYDKIAARRHARRVPERVLLLCGALGGAGGMLITMKVIRHKTRKPKFMVFLPLLVIVHILLIALWARGSLPFSPA